MSDAVLYNGIALPDEWPPRTIDPVSRRPVSPPYLQSPPTLIPIDAGRQLFVDDFLIERTTLRRTFHRAEKYGGNPIFHTNTELEQTGARYRDAAGYSPPMACTFDDGVFYDETDGRFKMWYAAGSGTYTALAYSADGLHWERPSLDVVDGTNAVFVHAPGRYRDSFSPWIDAAATDEAERYKAFLFTTAHTGDLGPRAQSLHDGGWLYTSADGIHWQERAQLQSHVGDNTNLFYNPYRRRWCLGIRGGPRGHGRARRYLENAGFLGLAAFRDDDQVFWTRADELDEPDHAIGDETQLYGIAVVPYESLMLGVFTIHYGPHNRECLAGGFPKLTQLKLGYSRDGFHWSRPDRAVFIGATQRQGEWDRGYIRAAGGGCVVVGDRLYFYYSGYSGVAVDGHRHMYAGGSMHVAFLRRDGFASMDAGPDGGELITRPVTFQGPHLFVNARVPDAPNGALRVEVLDADDTRIEPFGFEACLPIRGDQASQRVRWQDASDLARVAGRPVRFRFHLGSGSLFSFWTSHNH